MRTDKQFFKSITLTALLSTGLAAGSIAQDTTTIENPETKAPVIVTTSPTGSEANVDRRSVIEITFSSEMDETTINGTTLLLHASAADTMHQAHDENWDDQIREQSAIQNPENNRQVTSGAVNGTISYSDKAAVFTPDEELKEGTLYTFTVTNGVKSSENIALENNHDWSFTTSGTTDTTYSDRRDNRQVDREDGNRDVKHGTDRFGMDGIEYSRSVTDTTLHGNINVIDLGKAGQFVILAKTDINNESGSHITGQTGEGSVADKIKKEKDYTDSARQRLSGQVLVLQSNQSDTTSPDVSEAIEDMMSAYSDATFQNADDSASQMNEHFQGNVLTPGVHEWSDSLHIESDVTLSGRADDVWLFKVGDNLTVHENTVITLTNGARASNVFWYVEGEVTIGKNAQFEGIILSMNEITLEKGAKLNGRMYSQTSITLDDNTVTEPGSITGQTTSTNR